MFCMQTINFETTQQDQESSWWLCMISFVTQNKNICIIWRLIAIMAKKFILTNHTKCSNFWSSLFKELFKIPVKTPRFRWCYVYGSWIIIVLVSAQGSGYKPAQFGLTLLQLPIMHYGETQRFIYLLHYFFGPPTIAYKYHEDVLRLDEK